MLPAFCLVIWFALQRVASGAVNCSSPDPVLYLNTTADDTAAAECGEFWVDVFIAPSQTGAVSLDGLKSLGNKAHGGGLHVLDCPQVTSLRSDSLEVSGSWLAAANSSLLTKLSFPRLSWIGLGLFLTDVPSLDRLELANGVVVGELDVTVSSPSSTIDNTALSTIDGLFGGTPRDISITNNPRLHKVHLLSTQILLQYNTSATGNLVITNNSANMTVRLPNLFSIAGSMSLGNVSELSIPSLSLINGSLELIEASFSSLSAPQLQRINGNLNITGSFSGLSFPNLTHIGGDLFLSNTKAFDCEPFRQLFINGDIAGSFTCQGATMPKSAASSVSSSGGGLSAGAKGGIAAGAVVGGLAVIGFVIVIMIKRKRREKAKRGTTTAVEIAADRKANLSEPSELPQYEHQGPSELEGTPNEVAELHGDRGPLPEGKAEIGK